MQPKTIKRTLASLGLCLLTAILSLIILFTVAHFLAWAGSVLGIGSEYEPYGEAFAYIVYGVFITAACFHICKRNPASLWYGPILCNAMGISSAIVEPTFWVTSLWMFICGGWVLSIIAAISGTKRGRQSQTTVVPL